VAIDFAARGRCNPAVTRVRTAVSLLALVATLASVLWLARLQAAGPRRVELELPGGIPATLHLPEASGAAYDDDSAGRPPAVALGHGIALDQNATSVLARALTQAGYAVLTFDFRGHGANRNPFGRTRGLKDSLAADFRTAVDFLRTSSDVDGHRISVMGHSMGARAALDYASFDPAIDATVMIAGGRSIEGPQRPSNALFIYAEGDPERTRVGAVRVVSELAGVDSPAKGVVFGSFDEGTAVSHEEVARANHISILSSQYAARQIIDWLDRCYGVSRGTFFLRADPRLRTALLGVLAFLFVLPGLGEAIGRLAPRLAERPGKGAARRLGVLAIALLGTLPLVAIGDPARLLPLLIANTVVLHLFAAGIATLAFLLLTGRFDASALRSAPARSLGASALAVVALFLLFSPFGVVFHGLGLTPERAVVALGVLILVAPFQLVFHYLLRRGGTVRAALASVIGRLLVIGVLVVAVQTGVLPSVVMLMLPVLAMLFVMFEVVSTFVYAASRNYCVPAVIESAWLAWILSAMLPVTV
jgi:dienelactone hydrolase